MKILRFLLALGFVSTLFTGVAFAGDKKSCDCEKDKDGKTCGVDKDCCCTGKKAEKKPEKKS
jgi:hypothetical protein